MNQKTLLKSVATIERIKVLDAEIISLEKLAMNVADRDHDCVISIKATDLTPAKEKKAKVLDEDGSLVKPSDSSPLDMMRIMYGGFIMSNDSPKKKEEKANTSDFDITNTDLLQVLGFLIGSRDRERTQYMEALNDLGVVFN
jgi:hypothetical protein